MLLWPGGGTLGARVVDDDRIGELETHRARRDRGRAFPTLACS
jgi:hypothetical protein